MVLLPSGIEIHMLAPSIRCGCDGLLLATHGYLGHSVLSFSTISPGLHQKLNPWLEKQGIQQVDALMKGRSTEVYDRLLTEIDSKRKQMQARIATLEPQDRADATDYSETIDRIAEVLMRLDAVLSAEDVTTVIKNGVLFAFIRAIYPEGDGYSVELRLPKSSSSLGSQQMISTH
jgi:hypothetical protein